MKHLVKQKVSFWGITLALLSIFLWYFYLELNTSGYLHFSGAAKFADIARKIVAGSGHKASFSFFSSSLFKQSRDMLFVARGIPAAMPLSIAAFFSLFGVLDSSVIFTSGLFYVLLVLVTFALGKKLFGNLIGFLAGVAVASNLNFLDYATSGASESLFALEVVLAAYLILLQKRKLKKLLKPEIELYNKLRRYKGFKTV